MANTRETIGEQAALDGLVARSLTSFEENGVTSLRNRALWNYTGLKKATFPALTTNGQYAFNSTGLEHISEDDMPALTIAGSYGFGSCASLKDATFKSKITVTANAFNGCINLEALILKNSSMSTLSNVNALSGTKIALTKGAVYVPSDLVSTYKANSNWKNFFIASIDDYPLTDFGTIKDSFAQINAACNDGTYATKYAIGDTKTIDCGDEGVILAELRGIDVDDKADGSGKAKLTFVFKGMLKTTKQMNSTATTTGGYDASGMKSYVNGDIWPLLPDDLKSIIVAVTKVSSTYENSAVVKDGQTTTEKLWLLSDHEAGLGNTYETTGPVYFSSASERIKYNQSGSTNDWWLRSAASANSFRYVNNGGSGYSNNANITNGVVLGFCIG